MQLQHYNFSKDNHKSYCLGALFYPDRYWLHKVYSVSTSLGMALHTAVSSPVINPKSWSVWEAPMISASHPNGCMEYTSRSLENIRPLTVTWISPSLGINHPLHYAYLRCMKTERDSKRENLYYFSSPLRKHFALWKILSLHFVDGTNEIIPGCMSHRQLPRSLWYRDRHVSETWKLSRSLVKKTPQAMFLWALLYPAAAQYTDSTWTSPVWVGHYTQQDFQVETSLSPSHPHIPLLNISWYYNKDLLNSL